MKNLLIIYPHWAPSNLAGVHRPRLIGNYLHLFGWQVHLLTVKSEYYEEAPDNDMLKTVAPEIKVYYTEAKKITRLRLIGDIGLRAFKYLKKEALNIIRQTKIDFIWIPIPSFYVAILGRILNNKTGIPYGIDYIDPWVRDISNRKNMRARLSNIAALILEPYAVKKASLISGVSSSYYQKVLDRNFKNKKILHVGMPYGFDINDHRIKISGLTYTWDNDIVPFVYAGAFLPNSGMFLDMIFKGIKTLISENKWNTKHHLYFVGTGNYGHKSITDYAKDNMVSDYVHELRERKPFLHILNYLSAAKGVIVVGSTEKHYTASKIFQSILSMRPIYAVFHYQSTAVEIMKETNTHHYLTEYLPTEAPETLQKNILQNLVEFLDDSKTWNPSLANLDKYSAKESARQLAEYLDKIVVS